MNPYRYKVTRLAKAPEIDANWDKAPWTEIAAGRVANQVGCKPEHMPETEFKVAYDRAALYAIFRVKDRFVRAVASAHQGAVCRDSCVEFFFSPGTDAAKGYFNLEMNCGGTMLFHFQRVPRKGQLAFPSDRCRKLTIGHSMPAIVDPEIAGPVAWTVEYRLPLEILEGYRDITQPAPGVEWRANFYKCADDSSHPHWFAWSPVDSPKPDFHVPAGFGVLEFE